VQLQGKKIIVTGAARGLGEATVRAYVSEGAAVACLDVLDELGSAVAEHADSQGPGNARYYHCDVSDRGSVGEAFKTAVADLNGLDVMVNIAGVERQAPAEEISDHDWDLIFDVNVRGTFLTNQAAFAAMRAGAAGGRILNFGSDAGLVPFPMAAHYSASKGAVMAWTRTVAHEWGRHGITVNSVVPAMWTPMYNEHRARMTPEQLAVHDAGMDKLIPLGGRLGNPDADLAPVMVFLAGDGARFITGQVISVNGGLGTVR
jgi:NAD(P)-dependent dehydrogenase (short-subunit alcohol dehydrogenase family)